MLPTLDDAKETAEQTSRKAMATIPWLPDPFMCPECDVPCEHSQAFDPIEGGCYDGLGGERPTYLCPECGTHYRREADAADFGFDPYKR